MRWFKKLTVPETNDTKEIEAAQTWEVRWTSRYAEYSSSTSPQVEVFYSEELAEEFKKSLENAFKLLKHTGAGTQVTIKKSS